MGSAVPRSAVYQYAVASRALGGERHSGDAALVQPTVGGALVAVIDGLGHGDEAAAASGAALGALRAHAGEPVLALLRCCHEALLQTRGAAMALGALDALSATLSWTGVGNIEAVLVASGQGPSRGKLCLTNRSGVVGYRLPPLDVSIVPIFPGDLLILATDGVDCRFACEPLPCSSSPAALARAILERHGKASDDALVLVLRWFGQAAGDFLRTAR